MGVAWIRRLVLYLVGPARTTCEICGVNDATDVNPDGSAGGICDACLAIHFIGDAGPNRPEVTPSEFGQPRTLGRQPTGWR